MLDTSKWLDDDFADAKLKNFDEMREHFIEDLTNQFSDLLVPNYQRERHQSVRIPASRNMLATTEGDEAGKTAATSDPIIDAEMVDEQEEHKSEEHDENVRGDDASPGDDRDSEESSGNIPDEKLDDSQMVAD